MSSLYGVSIKWGIYNRRCIKGVVNCEGYLLQGRFYRGVSLMKGVYYKGCLLKGVSFIVELYYRGCLLGLYITMSVYYRCVF